jgi:hypothetical protein
MMWAKSSRRSPNSEGHRISNQCDWASEPTKQLRTPLSRGTWFLFRAVVGIIPYKQEGQLMDYANPDRLPDLKTGDNKELDRWYQEIAQGLSELESQDVDTMKVFLHNKGVLSVFRLIWARRSAIAARLLADSPSQAGGAVPLNPEQIRHLQGRATGMIECIALFADAAFGPEPEEETNGTA